MDGAVSDVGPRRILHVGCGGEPLPEWLADWLTGEETRLDISPEHSPDIIANMSDMPMVANDSFHAVFSCHSLEHLYPHEAIKAVAEFYRVLQPGGMALIMVPDLEGVQADNEVLFEAPSGPVTGVDLIYGMQRLLHFMPFMAHHTGFIQATLRDVLRNAGFSHFRVDRLSGYHLFGVAVK